jgi:hypothetical protein
VTMLATFGTNPPVASTHLFWNQSIQRVALLDGAYPIDSFAAPDATIAADGTVQVAGSAVTGPLLVEEYASAAQLEHARLIARQVGTSLWLPASKARLASLTEGLYLDGWLASGSRIRVWPSDAGGKSVMHLTLSLPTEAPTQTVTLKGSGIRKDVVVASGRAKAVTIEVDRNALTTLTVSCPSILQVGGRMACAKSTVPELTSPNSVSR